MNRRAILILSAAAVCTAGLVAESCVPSDATTSPYLLVSPAADQPVSPALGTVVVAQQSGGDQLRLRAQGGTLGLIGDAAGKAGGDTACVPVATAGTLYYFEVIPTDVESLLFVELLRSSGSAPASGCAGTVLETRVVPITTVRNSATTSSGVGGAGGAGGAAGAGGAGGGGGAGGAGGGGTDAGPDDAGDAGGG